MVHWKYTNWVLLVAGLSGPLHAQDITVSWRDKPPYHYTENGADQGFLLVRSQRIFAAAGLRAHFVKEPAKRIMANLQSGVRNYCSIGWYMLPERYQFAQFSKAIHTDLPHTVLVAPGARQRVESHATLASLLADTNLILGVVDGVSYGSQIDALIAGSANKVVRRTVDPLTMLRMVAAGRVSFAFMDKEDLAFLDSREPGLRSLMRRDFPDMPPGQQRAFMCSKDVPASIMARIDKAIEGLPAAQK